MTEFTIFGNRRGFTRKQIEEDVLAKNIWRLLPFLFEVSIANDAILLKSEFDDKASG